MKTTVAITMLAGVLCGQDSSPASPFSTYDSAGHLVGYRYPDGKTDQYAYDLLWRMVRYTDGDAKITVFKYDADGSMTVVSPDGSITPR